MDTPKLHPHQIRAAGELSVALLRYGAALDASGTGTGKTHTACAVAQYLKRPTGVICPKQVRTKWRGLLKEFGVNPMFVEGWEMLRTGNTKWICRPGMRWNVPPGSLLIWDEAQKAQGVRSLNAQMMVAAKSNKNLLLSATLAEDPLDMWGAGFLLGLHGLRDFYPWALKHGCYRNPWGGIAFRKSEKARRGPLGRIHARLFPDRGVRTRKEDLGDMFPDEVIELCPVDLSVEDRMALARSLADLPADTPEITVTLRERMFLESLKVGDLAAMVSDQLEEGNSVAVFMNFTDSLHALADELKCDCIIDGGVTDALRLERQNNFLADRSRVILLNTCAGGVALDLHDMLGNHPRVALHVPTYSAKDNAQALGRIHRVGAKSKVVQRVLYAPGTVEEEAVRALTRKHQNMEIIHDGIID